MPFRFKISNNLVKDTFVYTATDAIGKAISFILLPFLSYYMSPDDMGLATNFTVMANFISLIAALAIINSLPYFFYERNKEENRILVSNLVIMSFVACLALLFIIIVCHRLIAGYLKIGMSFQLLSVLMVISSVFSNLNLQLYRLEDKARLFAIYQIAQILLHCILVILFVIVLKGGGEGKIYAEALTVIAMGAIHYYVIRKRGYLELRYNRETMKSLMKFGLPLMPHSISFWFKGGADKIIITTFVGLASNGIYSMALSITSLYSMLSNSFFNAYVPTLQRRLASLTAENEDVEKRKIVKTTYLLIFAFFFVSVITVLLAWFILKFIIDVRYYEAFKFIPGIILASYISLIYSFSIQFIYKKKKTLVLGFITFTGSLIQMILSYFLVKEFGVMGAVYSSIVGSLLVSIAIFTYSNRVYPLPWLYFIKAL